MIRALAKTLLQGYSVVMFVKGGSALTFDRFRHYQPATILGMSLIM